MPNRSDWLTNTARPIADSLATRCGSLKKIISAGVMVLNDLKPEQREYYMAKADGEEIEPSAPRKADVESVVKDLEAVRANRQRQRVAKTSKSG